MVNTFLLTKGSVDMLGSTIGRFQVNSCLGVPTKSRSLKVAFLGGNYIPNSFQNDAKCINLHP